MSRTTTALALIVAGSLAFAGLSAGCSWKPPAFSAPDGQADTMAPPPLGGTNPKGGLKITPEVKPEESKPAPPPIPDVNNDGKLNRTDTNAAAIADFHQAVKRYTGWMMGLVGAASVLALLLSFTPLAVVSWQKSTIGFGIVGAMLVCRLALLKNGELAADLLSWALLILCALAMVPAVWIAALWFKDKILVMQGKRLAEEGKARESTALLAAGNDKVNAARAEVAQWIEELQTATGPQRAKLLSKLRDKGINL